MPHKIQKVATTLLFKATLWTSLVSLGFIASAFYMFGPLVPVYIQQPHTKKETPREVKDISKIEFNDDRGDISHEVRVKKEQFSNGLLTRKEKVSPTHNEVKENIFRRSQEDNGSAMRQVIKHREENVSILHDLNAHTVNLATDNVLRFANRKKTKHIAFLKVHKAGSTTIQNMLFRFGLKHNLNIVIPTSGNSISKKNKEMPIEPNKHYDIFAIHTKYNQTMYNNLLPADSVNIGIIREPLDRMISAAYYHRDVYKVKYLRVVPRTNFVHNLINYPEIYDRSTFSQTRNTIARDFGFPKTFNETEENPIGNYLKLLNSRFLIVLIMEKMDESLIYMRRQLNWSIGDILYWKMNSHTHERVVLNQTDVAKFRKIWYLDIAIYDYFSAIFEEKLKRSTDDFWAEVKFFKSVVVLVNKFCQNTKHNNGDASKLVIQPSTWEDSISVSASDCVWMGTTELTFINQLRKRHARRHEIK